MENERFWSKIDKRFGCWEWTGALNRSGYGVFWSDNKAQLAHRFSYSLVNPTPPKGMEVRHKCDNKLCVNPQHLIVGTKQQNLQDRNRRKRTASGVRNGRSKLTPAKVAQIRLRFKNETQTKLALEFGVSRKNIYLIVNNLIW